MRHSDNSLAEEFGRLLALQVGTNNSPAGAVQAVKSVLERKGITTTGLDGRNCSGLTEDSKLTARTLLECNCAIWLRDRGRPQPKDVVMGFVGTAESRLNDADEAGLIGVKTGSLGDVTSMTGNVSRLNGGALTFAVIVNNPTHFAAAKAAIEHLWPVCRSCERPRVNLPSGYSAYSQKHVIRMCQDGGHANR